ncbi:MAG: glutamate synthase-related protein [Chloroflexi bacterium]|jgi:glutamate synthase domain-containing protein 2/glutamate synthase domain-containing protein 1/glutamate synthase domain-containing protein 3|nr:glutamate synthase-related protein [Chloroflexota bacterium]
MERSRWSTGDAPAIPAAPLYDPRFEHDACGVGFVAETSRSRRRSARVVPLALEALAALTHRGAIAADAVTGDGAGIALPVGPGLLAALDTAPGAFAPGADAGTGAGRGPGAPHDLARLAVGAVFLPTDRPVGEAARRLLGDALAAEGLAVRGWRRVPVDPSVLGPEAAATAPDIRHILVARPAGMGAARFERALLLARRTAEAAAATTPGLEGFHVASLSARTLVYKGLFVGAELGRYYADLGAGSLRVPFATFHQRYSTNTHPSWALAQPFRLLAHNGEINTVRGNREAMRGRAARLGGGRVGRRLGELAAAGRPLLDPAGSDSTSLDEALELLLAAGWRVDAAVMALLPEALELRDEAVPGLAAWQAATVARVEPWDGPAALVFTDGRRVGCVLDRNGLRPAAFEIRRDGLVVCGSEAGMLPSAPGEVVRRGRLGPGELLVVDTGLGHVLEDGAAKRAAIAATPSGQPPRLLTIAPGGGAGPFADAGRGGADAATAPRPPGGTAAHPSTDAGDARRRQVLFGLDAEQLRMTVRTMVTTGREPTWSMGDDTPLAVMARRPRGVAGYLRQAFAQVTNPPIDPERERVVMTLEVPVGPRPRLLDPAGRDVSRCVRLPGPVLGSTGHAALLGLGRRGPGGGAPWSVVTLDASFPAGDGPTGVSATLDRLVAEAGRARDRGADLLVISDRRAGRGRVPVASLLAVGAVNAALVDAGRRDACDVLVEAGDAFDVHAVAMLLAAGADVVHPWHALALAHEIAGSRGLEALTPEAAEANLLDAFDHGLRKVLARMGISTLASYRGGQLFDVLGLADDVAERCFPAAPRTPGSTSLERLGAEALARHASAHAGASEGAPALADPGVARFRADGELHAFAPVAVKATQALAAGHPPGVGPGAALAPAAAEHAVDAQLAAYRAALARDEPAVVRDLLVFRPARPVPLAAVEPASEIVLRFVSSAMSLGALSPEAHRALAIGMRRLGAASNSGEGGEDPAAYEPDANGEIAESAIKQVASARFGVTARYLARAEQLEIKMAQGSKPGEGGQLPAKKATPLIAALRRGQVGMTYISPPPHHDIYSIEDLAQLIADLRAVNPSARIGVKLVASAGVGTIAAGVAKAHADYVLVSGHAGGTGASPLSSIKSAGAPWEIGLAEAHQVLVRQGLRDRVTLRTDGGLQTGRDVVVAALLGAEEYAFGTAALVAIGCDMARQCHLDTCPTGIATQREDLRAKFTGTPEQVVAFFTALAEDVRRELAAIGFRSLADAIGRTDRLALVDDAALDLVPIVGAPPWRLPASRTMAPRTVGRLAEAPPASPTDERLAEALAPAMRTIVGEGARVPVVLATELMTGERTVGARISGELERARDAAGGAARVPEEDGPVLVDLRATGAAGQSLGAFATDGVRISVSGVANDYVAKGLSGGTVVVRPPTTAAYRAEREAIAGNTCLYGATGGRLHLVGRAGMRFAVRNSGAHAVVEGIGAHGCEYMTGGVVVVLGPTGRNLGAGMTGGRVYLHDPDGHVALRINAASVRATSLAALAAAPLSRADAAEREEELRALVQAHAAEGSGLAATLLAGWSTARAQFWLVEPLPAT